MFFKRKKTVPVAEKNGIFSIQWGGFYTYKTEDGKYGVLRLLDFNKDAYHAQLFQEKFDHQPSFDEVKNLKPFVWHAPIATAGLLNYANLKLVGHEALNEQSLMGYDEYLRQMGADEAAVKEMQQKLAAFSQREPLEIVLSISGDQLVITPQN